MERRRPRQPPTRPLILLAACHADTCALYVTPLGRLGFETTTVSDGADAYACAWQTHPDVIVTELFRPQFDGWAFMRDLKSDPRTREIPVVIVATDGHADARTRAVQEGCSAFLLEPCVPEKLAQTLREVLNTN